MMIRYSFLAGLLGLVILWVPWVCAGAAPPAAVAAPRCIWYRRPAPLIDRKRADKMKLVYFVPADRKPVANYRQKIQVVATFVNDLYRHSLTVAGYKGRSFDFEFTSPGQVKVHLVRGKHKAAYYSGAPKHHRNITWKTVPPEVQAALGSAKKNLYLVFAETYDNSPCRFEWAGSVTLGAAYSSRGGVALVSSWILQDQFCATTIEKQLQLLADTTPVKGRIALGHGRLHSPRFEFVEDGLGASAHELGHALGVWHDRSQPLQNIMCDGYRRLRHNYLAACAKKPMARISPINSHLLAYNPYLYGLADTTDAKPPTIRVLAAPATIPPKEQPFLEVTVKFTDDKALATATAYCSWGDSVVWGQAFTSASLPTASKNSKAAKSTPVTEAIKTIRFPLNRPTDQGKSLTVHIVVVDRAGHRIVFTREFPAAAKSTPSRPVPLTE